MDSFKTHELSLKGEEEEHRRKTRRRLIIISVSSVVLVLLMAGAIVGILLPIRAKKNNSSSLSNYEKQSIKSICGVTLYQESCYSSIYSLKLSTTLNMSTAQSSQIDTPKQLFMLSLQVTLNELISLKSSIISQSKNIIPNKNGSITLRALDGCSRLIQDAVDHVNISVASLQPDSTDHDFGLLDVRTWLSTALTDQQTCLDGLIEFQNNISVSFQRGISALMINSTIFTSNSLAIVSKIPPAIIIQGDGGGGEISVNRKVLQITQEMRLLMEASLRPNLTVAKDGSGDYETISEAVNAMPKRSKHRFFIHVKKGKYNENVHVDTDSWNLMLYGDGMEITVVSSNLNNADGVGTYDSGTLIAEGRGFIAKDMGFKNTAGPEKFQAVALRSSSDQSVFYRCNIEGYQDTLYTHTNRQFYRECVITGTIDFIFGNAAAVFQNCTVQARQPMKGQYNTITAQSKSDPNQNTGISIQRCSISPLGNLTARTYFGRPWNVYSTTVVLETEIKGGIIDPAGWSAWEPGTQAPDTIFYAEYNNSGPGSLLDRRVTWPGYKPGITDQEAQMFSVEDFIQGNKWLHQLNIRYDPHL